MNNIIQNILGRKDKPMRLIGKSPEGILVNLRTKRFDILIKEDYQPKVITRDRTSYNQMEGDFTSGGNPTDVIPQAMASPTDINFDNTANPDNLPLPQSIPMEQMSLSQVRPMFPSPEQEVTRSIFPTVQNPVQGLSPQLLSSQPSLKFVEKIKEYTKVPINYSLRLTDPASANLKVKDIYGINENPYIAELTDRFRRKI